MTKWQVQLILQAEGVVTTGCHKVTGAVDFAGRRRSEDRVPVQRVDFDKMLTLPPLEKLIFLLNKDFIRLPH